MDKTKIFGLVSGPSLFILLLLFHPQSLSYEAAAVGAVALWMAAWWLTGAIPIPVTALLPVVLFPVLSVMPSKEVTLTYGNHLIFLFLGGFLLAIAIEKWNLHRRIALYTIKIMGNSPERIIMGFMLATALLSMWISNTATTMMMVPIALSIITKNLEATGRGAEEKSEFGASLMLGIAYAASIGGVATLIGTPPNTIMAGFIDNTYGQQISFAQWMVIGVPLSVIMLAIAWVYITKFAFRLKDGEMKLDGTLLADELKAMGKMSSSEKRVLTVFFAVAIGWLLRGFLLKDLLPDVSDATIAVGGAVLLFILPSGSETKEKLLDWKAAVKIPWDIILLFGGGLALAKGFHSTQLDIWLGNAIGKIGHIHIFALVLIVGASTMLLTELTSNTATAAMLIPIIAGAAIAEGMHPYGPIVAVTISSSYAFMLPVATPPNAIVFGSHQLTIAKMAKTGVVLNIIGLIIIALLVTFFLGDAWGFDLYKLPGWAH